MLNFFYLCRMLLRTLHITLAGWLLLSSTGAPLFRHICMNRVRNVSLFVKAETCQPSCTEAGKSVEKDGFKRKKCCENQLTYLKFSTDSLRDYFFTYLDIIAILPTLPYFRVSAISTDLVATMHYRSPPLIRAIPIWVQSFRC